MDALINDGINPLKRPFYQCQCGWMGTELNWSRLHPRKGLFRGYCPQCGRTFEGVYRTAKELRAQESGGK